MGYRHLAARLARAAGVAALVLAAGAFAQVPPGTVINNQATGSFTSGATPFATNSNTVSLTTGGAPVATFAAVLTSHNTIVTDAGATVHFPHRLTNTGTMADTYNLTATDLGLSWTFTSLTLLPDANFDGVPDSAVPVANPIALAPGASFGFVLRAVVPFGVMAQTQDDVRISVVSTAGATVLPNMDRATIGGVILPNDCSRVTKWISTDRGPSPNAPVTITLAYDACDQARERVVLTDALPAGMRYIAGSARWSALAGVPLTDDIQGADRQGSAPQQIAYDFGVTAAGTVTATAFDLPAGAQGNVTFQVEIAPGLAFNTVVSNTGSYLFNGPTGAPGLRQSTNTVTYTVTGRADLELTGQRLPTATPGATAVFTNVLRNLGDAPDTFDVTFAGSTFPAGTVFSLFQADGVSPLADTDGNGTPDTGPVAAGASYNIILRALIPETALPGAYKVTKTARSARVPMRSASADDAVDTLATRCQMRLDPDNQGQTGYGRHVTYTHRLSNQGNCTENVRAMVSFIVDSKPGWTSSAFVDNPVASGASIVGSLDATDPRVDAGWNMDLAPGQSIRLLVDVMAPTLEQAQGATASKRAKDVVDSNVTTLGLMSSVTGALSVKDTTILDDKADGPSISNEVHNHTDSTYAVRTLTAVIGRNAYIGANAAACNAAAFVAESRTVVVTGPNGEREEFVATETGADTGLFRISARPVRRPPVVAGDGILQGRPGDVFEIEVLGCGMRISGVFTLIEPAGYVFDSATNVGISGAIVTLVSGSGGTCGGAAVTVPGGANPLTTDADGRFAFATAPAGEYCVRVQPPNGFAFPSRVAYTALAPGRNLIVTGPTSGGSYGSAFASPDGAIVLDLPVDTASQDGLFVQKLASRSVVEMGEFVDYSVKVRNNTGNALVAAGITLVDDLPAGFAYVAGTARRNGSPIADPAVRGPRLTLALGAFARDQEATLTYRVRVGPGALQGDGVNRAQAVYSQNGTITRSNVATAKVQVVGGVFSERGFLLGKVFLDCNANGVQDKGERGMPGVRLFLEDGTFAITDGGGKYNFYGLTNRTHVLKVDRASLPAGAQLKTISSRQLGDAGSRIVDLKASELHRGDFAIAGCGASLLEEAQARETALGDGVDSLQALSGAQLTTEARIVTDARALPAAGTVSLTAPGAAPAGAAPGFTGTLPATAATRPTPAPGVLAAAPAAADLPLENVVPELDNKLGFVGLKDGDVLPYAQATIRVKGTAGSNFKLRVNGSEVSEKRVGKRAVLADKQIQAWEYIGVELKPGKNELVLAQVDQFGNARGTVTIAVMAPGELGKIVIEVPASAVADGQTTAKVVVKLLDAEGVPVTARTPVTLDSSLGHWKIVDPNPAEPGVQAFVEGGRASFEIRPPMEPGAAEIVVRSGKLSANARLDFLPDMRSLVATGILEGIVNLRNLRAGALVPTRAADGFEQEIKHLSREWRDGKGDMGARAAFFLKGKIKGDLLLTAAYDSDKDTKERLFRDIQPDEFYPVYGDSATRGFDAQSTSKLYVRVDHQRSYLLWGDFTTQSASEVRKLSNYSRSLTGLKSHYENGRVSANVFASRDSLRQVIEELRANGTSGPYELGNKSALVNSEKVEILVRDRDQPSIVRSTLPQMRFVDYEIEPLTGRILFKGPVASIDRDLNPVFIRVTYEVDQGGQQFWVAGADVKVKVTDRIEVGGSYVKDENPQAPFQMAGVNAVVKLGEATFVTGEFARTESGLAKKEGDGARIEVKHESKDLKANAFVAKTDREFENPGAYLSQGRGEAGGKLEYKINDRTMARAEVLRSEDTTTGSVRDGVLVGVARQIGDKMTLEVGVRHAAEKGNASPVPPVAGQPLPTKMPDEVTTARVRLTTPVPFLPNATVYGEAEVDVKDADRRVLAAGGEYQLPNRGRVYARHEFISSITGPYGLNATERQNTTAVGVDMDYMKDGRLFSEYRIRDALAGGDTEAAVGLKNLWTLAPGLRLGTSAERVHSIAGPGMNENTAFAVSLEYTANPDWKASTRLEVRDGKTQDSILHTVGFAAKINKDWTALVRNAYSVQRSEGGEGGAETERKVERFQAGLAWRDNETNQWNALGRVEHRMESDDSRAGLDLKTTTTIVSVHADWQPIRPFLVTGRYAAKWANERSNGISTKYRAHLIGGRATWEFAPKWDIGIAASALIGEGANSRHYGVGIELGYQVATNLWVSAGYNFFGYRDTDLAGADYTAKGPFVRLRYKFDETLLQPIAASAIERKAP